MDASHTICIEHVALLGLHLAVCAAACVGGAEAAQCSASGVKEGSLHSIQKCNGLPVVDGLSEDFEETFMEHLRRA